MQFINTVSLKFNSNTTTHFNTINIYIANINKLYRESTIIHQLSKEKETNEIEAQLNKMKQSSVKAKTPGKRKEIFDEIIRMENEEKQRKLEELLKKINGS